MSRAVVGERSPAVTPSRPSRRLGDAAAILGPAALLSLALHLWAVMSPAARVNSDEALTGLQAYNILHGRFAAVVEGNDYGGTLESYLTAPLLLIGDGTAPLKVVPIVLSFVAGLALAWAAAPLLGRRVALVAGAVCWVSSGSAVMLWSLNYMGYATGAIAMVVAIGCAVRLMTRPRAGLALAAGLAAGVALWGHPMYGVVAALGCLPLLGVVWRRPIALLAAVVGALAGASPWLHYLYGNGMPLVAQSDRQATYLGRVRILLTELIPSGFGLRSPVGAWVEPLGLTRAIALVVIGAALAGLLMLPFVRGRASLPFAFAGLGAVPALATFQVMSFSTDGRYAVAFVPSLLVGLFAWTQLRPGWDRPPLAVAAAVPVVWGIAACVPSLHASVGWTWGIPNIDAKSTVTTLNQRGITAIEGEYWTVYVIDYYSEGRLDSRPDIIPFQRLKDDAARTEATPRSRVGYVYYAGAVEKGATTLPMRRQNYTLLPAGGWEIWVPAT